jgi:A/G-specific adenine glycosylase
VPVLVITDTSMPALLPTAPPRPRRVMSTRKAAQKVTRVKKSTSKASTLAILGIAEPPTVTTTPAIPPCRSHAPSYHWPLLLSHKSSSDALLQWFQGVQEERQMPWRKQWIDPNAFDNEEEANRLLAKRAYEVWVSEISRLTPTLLYQIHNGIQLWFKVR